MLTDATVIEAIPDQVSSTVGAETVILNLRNGTYFGLTGSGVEIWTLLQRPCTVEELHKALLCRYDVDEERCHGDLLGLLTRMLESGLVLVKSATPS